MKNTKRSMIITTVLMVVVLVVAISTSTFAWYTAANSGTASQANLVAANSDSANIALGWTATSTDTSITFNAANQTVSPAAPSTIPEIGTTTYAGFEVFTATVSNEGIFNATGTATNPWVVKGTGTYESQNYFYVINNNKNAGATVTMSIEYTDDVADSDPGTDGNQPINYTNNDKLVVAVFVNDVFYGIFTPISGGYTYGTLANNGSSAIVTEGAGLKQDNTVVKPEITFDLEKSGVSGNSAKISVKAWLDGTKLDQDYANQLASFSFRFSGATKN